MRVPIILLACILGPVRVEYDQNQVVISHLQKYSRCGFLITYPFCVHFWLFWRKQQQDINGGWIPGTEQGIYMRTPGWRYTAGEGMTWTNGYIGGVWD
jgi:hypothetical protein